MAFQDENDAILTIHVAPAKGSWNVDTEDATVTQLELSGQEAILIEKHPEIQIIWVNCLEDMLGNLLQIYNAHSFKNAEKDKYYEGKI